MHGTFPQGPDHNKINCVSLAPYQPRMCFLAIGTAKIQSKKAYGEVNAICRIPARLNVVF